MFHLSHKFNDEKKLMSFHKNLQDIVEDQVRKRMSRSSCSTF